jgi:hypothetical protein
LGTLAVLGDYGNTGSDKEGYGFESAQFIHCRIDLSVVQSLWVEDRLGVVKDYQDRLGGKEGPKGCHVLRVFDARADDLGEASEEMSARSRELVAADESTIVAKPFLDVTVMEDLESYRCFPDPPCTNQSDGF